MAVGARPHPARSCRGRRLCGCRAPSPGRKFLALHVAESAMAGSTNMACMPHVVRLAKAHEGTTRSEMLFSIWRGLPSTSEKETVGLLDTAPGLRPADFLTSAVSPQHLPALEAEGIEYRPLVWSCWGREHPDTTAVLTMLARHAARRRGLPSHKPLLQKTRAQVGAALARRSAAMLRACTPGAFQSFRLIHGQCHVLVCTVC